MGASTWFIHPLTPDLFFSMPCAGMYTTLVNFMDSEEFQASNNRAPPCPNYHPPPPRSGFLIAVLICMQLCLRGCQWRLNAPRRCFVSTSKLPASHYQKNLKRKP